MLALANTNEILSINEDKLNKSSICIYITASKWTLRNNKVCKALLTTLSPKTQALCLPN